MKFRIKQTFGHVQFTKDISLQTKENTSCLLLSKDNITDMKFDK